MRKIAGKVLFSCVGAPLLIAGAVAAPARAANLTITPTWDASINNDPNASTIKATINSVIQAFQFQFATPINVSILFKEDETIGLGQSSTYIGTVPYATYRAALVSHATTATDATALAHLPVQANNPVLNNAQPVQMTLPLERALGFNASPPAGEPDSTISLKTSLMNLSRSSVDPNKYDLYATVGHEVDEVLGTSSNLDQNTDLPNNPVNAADLFRYDASGNRIYSTAANAVSYFSLDGTSKLARYNQDSSGDYGDWYSPGGQTPQVQDAFATPGATPNFGVEFTVLDAVGLTPAAVPEPASAALLAVACAGLLMRRRNGLRA